MKAANSQQETGNSRYAGVLLMMKKAPGQCASGDVTVLREGSTGCVVVTLPRVWAVEETVESVVPDGGNRASGDAGEALPGSRPKVEVAFYRKYSEAMLRRYLRMSMEAGRVPSLLGREMFRGNVTSYRVHSFEDVVVFCLDVERCLARLNPDEKDLIRRVALQEYTHAEAAAVLDMGVRCLTRRYCAALDRLTWMFLKARMLEPLKSCQ